MSKKILVVDDERPLANALKLKLEKEGYEAVAVYDGEEAEDEIKKNDYDLVLLDLIMPKKDGFSVLDYFQKNKIGVPIIVCSNLGQEDDLKRAKSLGAVDYFIKSDTPITEIVNKVRAILKS